MPADLFARLFADHAFRAAVLSMPARRLQAGTQPPRCAYWWAVDPPSPAGGGD